MIRYYFICEYGHTFDCWFKSIEFFEKQRQIPNSIICPICGSEKVSRQLSLAPMASGRKTKKSSITTDVDLMAKYLDNLKSFVTNNFDYVGDQFKEVAMKIYSGETEAKNVYGYSTAEDLLDLEDQGVNFVILPFKVDKKIKRTSTSKRKKNS